MSPQKQPANLDEVADRAVVWTEATFAERTKRIEAGDLNVHWLDPEHRVVWSEIHAEFPELASVDGRLAYHDARVRAGLEKSDAR